MIPSLSLALALTLVLAAPALAASKRGNADLKRFCTGDAATFCGDVDPDSKAMKSCFAKHRSDLSEKCREAIDTYQAGGGR